jgi:hypothetical protein
MVEHSAERECDAWSEILKAAAGKLVKRAGATPLFRLSAAQKVRGVAPARLAIRQEARLRQKYAQTSTLLNGLKLPRAMKELVS